MTSNGLVPLIRYRDVAAAVEWLANAFGFERRNVVTDPDGTVAYAELSYGHGIVMLGPVGQSILDSLLKQPDELDGIGTQSVYVAVDDVEAHFERTRAAGASIVLEFGSDEAGDRAYAARDPEGHIWNFGAYSPWPSTLAQPLQEAAEPAYRGSPTRGQAVLGGSVALLAVASVAGLAALDTPKPMPRFAAVPAPISQATVPVAATDEAAALREMLAREAHARQEAARANAAIREALALEKSKRLAAEDARRELEQKLAATPPPAPEPSLAASPSPPVAANAPAETPSAANQTQTKSGSDSAAATTETPPATTGSLGEQSRNPAITPTAENPATPVSAGPAVQQEQSAPVSAAPADKPKPAPRPQAQRRSPKPAVRKNSGTDPFFLYD